MIKQSLWAEFIIGGSVYLLSLIIVISLLLGINDLNCFIEKVKDFWPILSILFIIFSYIFGFIAHRFIYIIFPWDKKDDILNNENTIIIYQYGSENLIENINHQYRLIVTSRILIFGLIILGIVLGLWLYNLSYMILSFLIYIFFVSLGIVSICITLKQKKDYKELYKAALQELKNTKNNKRSSNKAM